MLLIIKGDKYRKATVELLWKDLSGSLLKAERFVERRIEFAICYLP